MKRLSFLIAIMLVMAMFSGVVVAQECTSVVITDVSTAIYTGTGYSPSFGWPIAISTDVIKGSIYRITINNSNPEIKQVVDFYEWNGVTTATGTASERIIWQDVIGSTTSLARTTYLQNDSPVQESFWERFPLIFKKGLAVRKSDTASTVSVSIQYR